MLQLYLTVWDWSLLLFKRVNKIEARWNNTFLSLNYEFIAFYSIYTYYYATKMELGFIATFLTMASIALGKII